MPSSAASTNAFERQQFNSQDDDIMIVCLSNSLESDDESMMMRMSNSQGDNMMKCLSNSYSDAVIMCLPCYMGVCMPAVLKWRVCQLCNMALCL